MTEIIYQLHQIDEVAQRILPLLKHKVVRLEGSMGMGKTTLVKALAKVLGIVDSVTSPTFSIVNEYANAENSIFHFDFYRIKNLSEAVDFGLEEYLYSGNWCLMEWSEKVEELLPEHYTTISISEIDTNTRKLVIV